ncbi:hypothetical protein OIB37_21080 [Streptomyces sp. NBC_00820]|uniref:hypothetical protein n=1 Tax=Streptomyces sp. NBC_00820 TaxID=2975842 RepID=UPI002ED2C75F|nr:hypothetical protein OIB37_21080 [Streptomyces sp. NBC_00820]
MTRTHAEIKEVGRSTRRPRRALAVAALAAVSLAVGAAGTASAAGLPGRPAAGGGAWTAAVVPAQRQQAAFLDMLNTVRQMCVPTPLPEHEQPTPRERPQPPLSTALTAGQAPPSRTLPMPELGPVEECEGVVHVQRVTQALRGLDRPSPARVRKALNRVGYIDAHIHGLEQFRGTTHFYLDLRFKGSALWVAGSVSSKKVTVEAFAAPGSFMPGALKR